LTSGTQPQVVLAEGTERLARTDAR
jgi:hypothetical protein